MAAEVVCKVYSHSEGEPKKEAIIANFTHGILDDDSTDVTFDLFEQTGNIPEHRRKRKLVAETDRLTYVGQSFGPTAPKAAQYLQFMLGVYDEKKKCMTVYPASTYNLRPALNPESEDDEDEVDANKTLTYAQKSDRLITAFGSSKRKRAMESRVKNKVEGESLDHALGSAVTEALSQPDAAALSTPVRNQVASSVIPPFNKEANSPEEVYLLEDIISPEIMQAVHPQVNEFVNGDASNYPGYVQHHLKRLPLEENNRNQRICCLMYLHYMICLYFLKAADLRRKDPLPGVPGPVQIKLLHKFTENVKLKPGKPFRCMPARLKDTLLSHILVLCLILDEFLLEFQQLQKDLKIGERNLLNHLRALGCKVKANKDPHNNGKQIKYATLPIPLTFPEVRARKKSGKT